MSTRSRVAVLAAHAAVVLWLFGGALAGRVLYFRDISTQFAPAYSVAAHALRRGVWPLWDPSVNAGEPYLLAYPPDLVQLLLGGRLAPLGIGAALHVLLALLGGTMLARRLGMGAWGAWLAGTAYGLAGFSLSLVNLVPLHQAAAWAPWVIAAFLGTARTPSGPRLAAFAALLALQVSTLGAEIVLQTLIVGLVLVEDWGWLRDRRGPRVLAAGLLAGAIAAPAVLGIRGVLEGTSRGRGFQVPEAMQFSLHPVVLAEALLPKLLGEPHAFSDADYWGRAFFPQGYPYLLSLYVGLTVILLAAHAGRKRRLWCLALLGLVVSAGAYGPLGLLPRTWALPFRGPQKLFFLTHLSVALLAGFGLDAALRAKGRRRLVGLALPGLALLLVVLLLHLDAGAVRDCLARLVPAIADPRGEVAARTTWPAAWLPAGLLALAAGLALARGGPWAGAAGVLALLDLLIANGALNPLAPASFYDLRADVAGLVKPAAEEADGRWFSYGVAQTPGLTFEPVMARARSDVWLYYLDRQSLLPATGALDGLPSALGLDRTGWSPEGATLHPSEASPSQLETYWRRLQLAGVRWVLSFDALPERRVLARGEVKLPEVRQPLRLYQLVCALPRALWVPRAEIEADPARLRARLEDASFDPRAVVLLSAPAPPSPGAVQGGPSTVVYEAVDAHTVRVHASTPPGFVLILDTYHPAWTAEDQHGPVPLLRADGRYRALVTPGGDRVVTLRFRPAWRLPALVLSATASLVALALALVRPPGHDSGMSRARSVLFSRASGANDRESDRTRAVDVLDTTIPGG